MVTLEGFLQVILAEPEDDGLLLIFADWLEERGNERGKGVRGLVPLMVPVGPGGAYLTPSVDWREQLSVEVHFSGLTRPIYEIFEDGYRARACRLLSLFGYRRCFHCDQLAPHKIADLLDVTSLATRPTCQLRQVERHYCDDHAPVNAAPIRP